MAELLQRLRDRKLVQWALAYVAAAFALLQGVDIVAAESRWPESIERALIIVLDDPGSNPVEWAMALPPPDPIRCTSRFMVLVQKPKTSDPCAATFRAAGTK